MLLLERRHSLRRQHGRYRLPSTRVGTLPRYVPRGAERPQPAGAFIDTETSGLAGGTGTWAFICGVGRV